MLLPHSAVVTPRRRAARATTTSSNRHDKSFLEVRKGGDGRRGGLVVVRGHRLAQALDGLCPAHRGVDVGERLPHAGLGRVELANFPGDALGQGGRGGDALGEVLGVGAEGGDGLTEEEVFLMFFFLRWVRESVGHRRSIETINFD